EAITAFRTGEVHAMHDPTEGGVAGGIHEMADASHLGVIVSEESIPIAPETVEICRFFKVDPLQLVASGSLLIASSHDSAEEIVQTLGKSGIQTSVIGEFLPSPEKRLIRCRNGKVKKLVRPVNDHLWLALKQ
ncbi:hydrogenase, partial [Candidatus Bathyarchaeota archaeon]|nr:hydrogenase [Candidatus Bathyarchaeota archaeon]